MSVNYKSVLAEVVKDAKTVVTGIGVVVAYLTQALPLVPDADKHWVLAAVAVLTVVGRDVTDVVSSVPDAATKP